MTLTGTWVGEYAYGPGYQAAVVGTKVPFALSLTETRRAHFTGYVRDDASRGGLAERGRIRGRRKGKALEFVKWMPTGYVFDENGNQVPMREFLERVVNAPIPDELPPHRIHYTGTLDESGERMHGQWRIIPLGETGDSEQIGGDTGTWTARRMSDQPSEV